jgi:hypothetical protein
MGVKLLWVENSLLLRGVAMGEEELDGAKEGRTGGFMLKISLQSF